MKLEIKVTSLFFTWQIRPRPGNHHHALLKEPEDKETDPTTIMHQSWKNNKQQHKNRVKNRKNMKLTPCLLAQT